MERNLFESISKRLTEDYVELEEICNISKHDFQLLEKEFRKLKYEATIAIEKVHHTESRLIDIKRQENNEDYLFSQVPIRDMFTNVTKSEYEKKLEEEKVEEARIVQRRDEIERHLITIRNIAAKADYIKTRYIQLRQTFKSLKKEIEDIDKDTSVNTDKFDGIKALEMQAVDRQRIAREMHDGPVQSITGIIHKVELCSKLLDRDPDRAKLELQTILNIARNAVNDTRSIIFDLTPMSIDKKDLYDNLLRYVDKIEEDISYKINVNQIFINNKQQLKPIANLTLFRVIQEALNNITKHAKASVVDINIIYNVNDIRIEVVDNGIGFSIASINTQHPDLTTKHGFGLSSMRERTIMLGGSLELFSEPNKGTSYIITVPLDNIKGGLSNE